MMKYLIKVTDVATEKNINFLNVKKIYYYGKYQTIIAHGDEDVGQSYVITNRLSDPITKYNIKEYGYDRMCDAKRSYTYKHGEEPDRYGYWKSTVEIIKIEI